MTTYFTDFSEYVTGAEPSDWTPQWHASAPANTFLVQTDAGATGGQIVQFRGVTSDAAWTWDDIDSDANRDDAEVVFKFRSKETNGDSSCYALIRGSGGGATEAGYMLGLGNASTMEINVMDGGSTPAIATTTVSLVIDTWYWVRARVEGSALKMRMWEDGTSEPGTWDLETTDTTYTTAGWVGLAFEDGEDVDFDVFGVGTNGDAAPTSDAPAGQTVNVGLASETDAAHAVTLSRTRIVGLASETDTAYAVTPQRTLTVGLASETDAAHAVTPQRTLTVGLASETDTAHSLVVNLTVQVGLAAETDAAHSVTAERTKVVGLATETDAAHSVTWARAVQVGDALEIDTAHEVVGAKVAAVGLAAETDVAHPAVPQQSSVINVGLAAETDTPHAVEGAKTAVVGLAMEVDTALGVSPGRAKVVGLVTETDAAHALGVEKRVQIGLAAETDAAHAVEILGGAEPEPGGGMLLLRRRRRWV